MTKFIQSILVIVLAGLSAQAHAFYSPVSLSLIPPAQFPPSNFSISGVRTSIFYGRHRDVYGLDLGLIGNITEQRFVGMAIAGGFNMTKGQTTALLQAAGVANINTNKTDIYGAQIALGLNKNDAASSVTGIQFAIANVAPHTVVRGFQVGIYNRALRVYGFQIGLVNVADNLYGLQIGFANFHNKGLFPISPILNFGF